MIEYGLSREGSELLEEAADSIALLIYFGAPVNNHISQQLWRLFPKLLLSVSGDQQMDPEGGYAFDQFPRVAITIQNYISRDPMTFISQQPSGPAYI